MARTRSISDEQILDAAMEVFLERGPQGTTLEIAQRAGISEGTIFRRYPTKDALFVAALSHWPGPEFLQILDKIEGKGDLEENLGLLLDSMLLFFEKVIPRMHMSIASGHDVAKLCKAHLGEPPPVRTIRRLTHFFAAEQRLGRIGPGDPEIMARVLVANCVQHASNSHMQWNDWMPMPRQTYLRGIINLFLKGAAADAHR